MWLRNAINMNLIQLYDLFASSTGVSIDTRSVKKGNIFFAIKGENFDGNLYAEKAIEAGAKYSIVDNASCVSQYCFYVKDSLQALQDLATYHRQQLGIPILALTGSNGKTTTKELCAAVLKQKFKVAFTNGNLNNHLGVPLTLLTFDDTIELGIVEMGANHVGEIAELCEITRPNYGIITNIGKAHIGEFGGVENIIKAKGELYDYLSKNNGEIIYDNKDKVLSQRSENMPGRTSFADLLIGEFEIKVSEIEPYITLMLGELRIDTVLGGEHNIKNLTACIAVAKKFDVIPKDIQIGLETFQALGNRSQWIETDRNSVFLDAYNANPSSMNSAIQYFNSISGDKICILGEMLELGEYSDEEHNALIRFTKSKNLECYFIGESFTKQSQPNVFNSKSDFLKSINLKKIKDRKILIKASRGMKLESILELL